ncbi:MAG: hypothetical protein ACRC92_26115 [Peptostreptococcaceae bacterium]
MKKKFSLLSETIYMLKEDEDTPNVTEEEGGEEKITPEPVETPTGGAGGGNETLDDFSELNNEMGNIGSDEGAGEQTTTGDGTGETTITTGEEGGDGTTFTDPFNPNIADVSELNDELGMGIDENEVGDIYDDAQNLDGKVDEEATGSKAKVTATSIHVAFVGMYDKYSEFLKAYSKLDLPESDRSIYESSILEIETTLNTLKEYISSNKDSITTKIKRFSEFRVLFVVAFTELINKVGDKTNKKKN